MGLALPGMGPGAQLPQASTSSASSIAKADKQAPQEQEQQEESAGVVQKQRTDAFADEDELASRLITHVEGIKPTLQCVSLSSRKFGAIDRLTGLPWLETS